ncbi:MAG TPA: hypothetical protein VFA74_05660, partial [Terriglobales bacterium]|nr:hypothetical protein [Terriglobales bacterium]
MSDENDQAMRFVGYILESQSPEPGDLDGGEIQELLTKCGFLKETAVTEPCDPENCTCAEFGMPTTCYRWTDLARKARDV